MKSRLQRESTPVLPHRRSFSLTTATLICLIVFVALPITNFVNGVLSPGNIVQDGPIVVNPPVLPDERIEPPKPKEEPKIDELKVDPLPPSIQQMEVILTQDLRSIASGAIYVPSIDTGEALEEIANWNELSRHPRPITQRRPIYPPELRRQRVEGHVTVEFVITTQGSVTRLRVVESSNPGFEQNALKAVRQWRFQPGEKNGKIVNVLARQNIPFTIY